MYILYNVEVRTIKLILSYIILYSVNVCVCVCVCVGVCVCVCVCVSHVEDIGDLCEGGLNAGGVAILLPAASAAAAEREVSVECPLIRGVRQAPTRHILRPL